MLQVFEMQEKELCKRIGVSVTTLQYYLDSWRFSHIKRKKKKFLFPETGKTRHIKVYTVTNKDLQMLREFKKVRQRKNGILDGIY